MRKGIVVLFFQISWFAVFSQDIGFAKKTVDTLTTEYFAGRGAVNDGEKKAANFIGNHFKEQGLQSFNNSFFQEFNAPINTFPNKMEVIIDGKEIAPGKDFIIDAASGKGDGTYELYWFNAKNFSGKDEFNKLVEADFFADKFVVLALKKTDVVSEIIRNLKENKVGAAGVIFIDNKLTQHLSFVAQNYPIIHVGKEIITESSKSITVKIDQELLPNYRSQNVIGFVEGTEHPDSFIVLSAHYDHLGKWGQTHIFLGQMIMQVV